MFRFRPMPLLAAAACSAALAACSDSTTAPTRDPLVEATNRNLPSAVVRHASGNDQVTRPQGASGMCIQPYSKSGTGTRHLLCGDPGGGGGGGGVTYPSFTVSTNIATSTSNGWDYVTLSATASFTYASFGSLNTSFRNAGGCANTPTEYSASSISADNAPFTLQSSRDASYDGYNTNINWGVNGVAYGETATASQTQSSYSEQCY